MALNAFRLGADGQACSRRGVTVAGFLVCTLAFNAMFGAFTNRLKHMSGPTESIVNATELVARSSGSGWENMRKRARFSSLLSMRAGLDDTTLGKAARVDDAELQAAETTSRAFVFIKPHAVTEKVKELLREKFHQEGMKVISEGEISAETIDRNSLVDIHFGPIASKAIKRNPEDLIVSPAAQEEFHRVFRIFWIEALRMGLVMNAKEGAKRLGITPEALGKRFTELKNGKGFLKLGQGFYCGKIGNIFIINGFYFTLRSKFTMPGTSVYYFDLTFPVAQLSWADFRHKVIGATDPKAAKPGSLRNMIFREWRRLGLASQPTTADNSVHASASPFEALAERSNWVGTPLTQDSFGKAVLNVLPLKTLQYWTRHRHVLVPYEGKFQSLIDMLQDLDPKPCLDKLVATFMYQEEYVRSLSRSGALDWG